MVEVSVTATEARPKEDGDTAGDVTGLPQTVVVVVAVDSETATGKDKALYFFAKKNSYNAF